MVRPFTSVPMATSTVPDTDAQTRRQRWLSLLAKSPSERLEALWAEVGAVPRYTLLRRPEIGLVMVKGRISGTGAPFGAGEMTVTRAAVRLESGEIGFGYVGAAIRGRRRSSPSSMRLAKNPTGGSRSKTRS